MRRHRHIVLVVEDEGVFREQIEQYLVQRGCRVVCARHGREALYVLQHRTRACVILLDLITSSLAGSEFRRAQQYDAELRSIPVALLPPTFVRGGRSRLGAAEMERMMDGVLALAEMHCIRGSAFRRPSTHRPATFAARRPPRAKESIARVRS